MIELKNVYLGYNKEYYALFDINLKFQKGDRAVLVGENGSGKTSLLRVIAGLEKVQKGEIYIDNTPLKNVDFAKDVSLGYLSSKAIFYENKTVLKNLMWALKIRGEDKDMQEKKALEVLKDYNIEHLKDEKVGRLCKSDRRLVQIARLALRPLDILLCDEFDLQEDNKITEELINAQKKLINADHKDKIVIIACENVSHFKNIINREIKMVSGSIEKENKSEQRWFWTNKNQFIPFG